ncbi:putative membrane-bound acid phosphatase [Trypanosoma rangeli]|uniref:Putative membrane-bound acid phosphatase n=1 Tax=Trypanosoma rangeli TaxID=5698 RepID=A0A3R7MHJ7_TRYRA|nr:putative membrane-bound acid phosphatase [Trypanosoma rangeli]RNF06003.1 putative membrane-bound acid phosphatase [Trypanosoma rangeli]|eukprot:RNF06003.1 putative membrane-bound acid phosphatase [Trypanosoma rangeli]
MIYQPLIVAWCVAILLLAVTGANGLYVLELVQVIHRRGASPPPVGTPNRAKMCSPNGSGSCSAIANRGVEQMTAMGAYIQQLYNGDGSTSGSATWFQSPYDVSAVYTRSLADPATVQAAAALLRGVYANEGASAVPVIISAPPDQDTVLNVDAFPSVSVSKEINAAARNEALAAIVDENFPDAGVLSAMGAEVGLDAVCSAAATKVACCQQLQKLATMYAAVGATDGAPTVTANKAKLDAVAAAELRASQGYDANSPLIAARGSLGQPLVQELLRNMRQKMLPEKDANRNTKRLLQYAHQVPVGTTLGHNASDATPVGETFLMDLLRDDATHARFVRLRYAVVKDGAAAAAVFPFRCLNAAKVPTDATTADGIICPFDDFVRFIESSGGTNPAGAVCYLDERTKREFKCDVDGAAPSQECARYRALCPLQACPEGHIYDAGSGSCKIGVLLSNVMSNTAGVGVGFAAVACGFVLSLFVMQLCPMLFLKGSSDVQGQAPATVDNALVSRQ